MDPELDDNGNGHKRLKYWRDTLSKEEKFVVDEIMSLPGATLAVAHLAVEIHRLKSYRDKDKGPKFLSQGKETAFMTLAAMFGGAFAAGFAIVLQII